MPSFSSQFINACDANRSGTGGSGTGGAAAANQSPEQVTFEVPLFPGYVANANAKTAPDADGIAKQLQQSETLYDSIQERSRLMEERLEALRQQMHRQTQRHQTELEQLDRTWQQQFTALTVAPPTQPLSPRQPADIGQNSRSDRQSDQPSGQSKRRILSHIPTTYQVPRRNRVSWIENLLGSVPVFLWLVMLGMAIAGICAIALSPAVLWPSMSYFIRAAIPYLFVIGLVSLAITAVWDTFR